MNTAEVNVTYYLINDYNVFTFTGELTESNSNEVFYKIYNDIQDFSKKIIFNFSWLTYLENRAIWYIADIYSHVEENGWNFYITNCSIAIIDVLELVWIFPLIEYHKNMNKLLGIESIDDNNNSNTDNTDYDNYHNNSDNTLMQKIINKINIFCK